MTEVAWLARRKKELRAARGVKRRVSDKRELKTHGRRRENELKGKESSEWEPIQASVSVVRHTNHFNQMTGSGKNVSK